MIAMSTTTAPTPPRLRDKRFKIKITGCVLEEGSRNVLIKETEHEFIVTPPDHLHGNKTMLLSKCELMAREQYSAQLWERIANDPSLENKLADREWYIFTRTKKILPLY